MLSLLCQAAECTFWTMLNNLQLSVPLFKPLQSNFIPRVLKDRARLSRGGSLAEKDSTAPGVPELETWSSSSSGTRIACWMRPLPWPAVNCHWTSVPAEDKTALYVFAHCARHCFASQVSHGDNTFILVTVQSQYYICKSKKQQQLLHTPGGELLSSKIGTCGCSNMWDTRRTTSPFTNNINVTKYFYSSTALTVNLR